MNLLEVLLISLGVSVDAFALSVSGALTVRRSSLVRDALMAALLFGGFQFLMPLAGFCAAASMRRVVAVCDHWIAFVLLAAVGGKMVAEGIRGAKAEQSVSGDFFHWKKLFIPAVATSIDAMAVGAGIAFSGYQILFTAASMGVVTGIVCVLGVVFGRGIGVLAGERVMSVIGGGAIILIGANILRQHLAG